MWALVSLPFSAFLFNFSLFLRALNWFLHQNYCFLLLLFALYIRLLRFNLYPSSQQKRSTIRSEQTREPGAGAHPNARVRKCFGNIGLRHWIFTGFLCKTANNLWFRFVSDSLHSVRCLFMFVIFICCRCSVRLVATCSGFLARLYFRYESSSVFRCGCFIVPFVLYALRELCVASRLAAGHQGKRAVPLTRRMNVWLSLYNRNLVSVFLFYSIWFYWFWFSFFRLYT